MLRYTRFFCFPTECTTTGKTTIPQEQPKTFGLYIMLHIILSSTYEIDRRLCLLYSIIPIILTFNGRELVRSRRSCYDVFGGGGGVRVKVSPTRYRI